MIPDVNHPRNICPRTTMHGPITGMSNNRRAGGQTSRMVQYPPAPSDRAPLPEESGPQIDADGHRFEPRPTASASICVYLWAKRAAHPRTRTSCPSIRPRYFFNARTSRVTRHAQKSSNVKTLGSRARVHAMVIWRFVVLSCACINQGTDYRLVFPISCVLKWRTPLM